MVNLRKLDERVEAILAPDETARVVVATDIDQAGNFGEQWVVATDKRLLVVQPGENGKAPRNEGASRRKRSANPRCSECQRVLPSGSEICPACLPRGKIVLRMLSYVRPYAGLVILSFVVTLLVTVIGLSPPMM